MIYMFKEILYCKHDAFQNLRNTCLKYTTLILLFFFSAPGLAWQEALKKAKVKLHLLTDIDIIVINGRKRY